MRLTLSLPFLTLFVYISLLLTCQFLSRPATGQSQASSEEKMNEHEESEQRRLKVMEARTEEINSLLDQAVACYRQKELKKAIELFLQVIRLDPQNAAAHFSLAIAFEASGDLPQAASHYQQALGIEPDNKEYQQSAQTIKNKLDQQDKTKTAQYKLQLLVSQASEAFKQEQYDQALSLYKELAAEEPKQAIFKYNIGTIYLILKRPADALPYYKEAHKLEPGNQHYMHSLQKLELAIKQPAGQNLVSYFGLGLKSSKNGLVITSITPGSRAAQVGLLPTDTLKVIDGAVITKVKQLEQILESKPIGQRFQLIFMRNGRTDQILF